MCSFSRCEKEPKSVEGCDSLHTTRNAPWRSGARGQLAWYKKERFVNTTNLSFLFCIFARVAWNEKFVESEMHLSAVALKLLTNLSVSCSYSLIRRVKAKNALTLGGLLMWRLNKSVKQSTIGMFQKAIHSTVILSSRLLGSAPLAR